MFSNDDVLILWAKEEVERISAKSRREFEADWDYFMKNSYVNPMDGYSND